MRVLVFIVITWISLPLLAQTNSAEAFLKGKIDNWVAFNYSNAEFLEDRYCNYDSVMAHELIYNAHGFEGISEYMFGDFDQDGDTDCVFTYEISQCDGGNALWYTQEFAMVVNYENWQAQVRESYDWYFDDFKGVRSQLFSNACFEGFLTFEGITPDNKLVLKELLWSENAVKYPDLHRFHTFRFDKSMELTIERSTAIEEE